MTGVRSSLPADGRGHRRGSSTARSAAILAVLLALFASGAPAAADVFTVTTLADSGAGSLREVLVLALFTANGPHTVDFAAGLEGTIELETPLPTISEPVEIAGPGPEQITLDANQTGSVLTFTRPGAVYDVSGLTLTGGEAFSGGGIRLVSGSLSLDRVHLVDNRTTDSSGGGFSTQGGTSLLISRSVIARNHAHTAGGGGLTRGELSIEQSAIYANTSRLDGAGLWLDGSAGIFETTIYGNASLEGNAGALYAFSQLAQLTILHSSIVGNQGSSIGGIIRAGAGTTLVVGGVVFARNLGRDQPGLRACNGSLGVVDQNNAADDTSCGFTGASDLEGVDMRLLPLLHAGGPTPSVVPRSDSPLLDAAGDDFCVDVDQRGFLRPIDGDAVPGAVCDIGATEYTPGVDDTLLLFGDGFESGDLTAWSP